MDSPTISNKKWMDYLVLVIRCTLAFAFLRYGWAKLTGNQFGLNSEELIKPVNQLPVMRVAWYVFDLQPFKYFIGISQILCALLLLWNRTVLLGAALFLPIAVNILIIDMSIMPGITANALTIRLAFYLIFDLLIFYHYRKPVLTALQYLTKSITLRFRHSIGWYLLIPIFILVLEFLPLLPRLLYLLIKQPRQTWQELINLIETLTRHL